MIISLCVFIASLLTTDQGQAADSAPLTVGSSAPPIKLAAFLKGEPVEEISKGRVYVVEFSGIRCAPCIRAMPHLTALQKEHPTITFLSIYAEGSDEVRGHIAEHDANIGYRVALDDDHASNDAWLLASGIQGIPLAFLVAKDGTIAWIGMPQGLDAAIADLEAGSLDPRRERMRIAFRQANDRASSGWQMRRDRSAEALSRPFALARDRKWAEAVEVAERGARDFPDDAFLFHCAKLFVLTSDPQAVERAVSFAAEISAMMAYSRLGDLGKGRSGTFDAEIAQALLDGGRENDDPIITEAAEILIGRAEAGLGLIKDEDERFRMTRHVSQIAASLDARKKDYKAAAGRLRRTLALIRSRPCPEISAEAREAWEQVRRDQIEEIEVDLLDYVKADQGRLKP